VSGSQITKSNYQPNYQVGKLHGSTINHHT